MNTIAKNQLSKNRGFTLIEMMIGITVALIVMAGVTNVFVATVLSSSETLKAAKLNQELSAVMSILVNDVRRSGFWSGTSATNPYRISVAAAGYPPSPFNDPVDLNTNTADCILYNYDNNQDAANTAVDFVGFKRVVAGGIGHIEIRTGGSTSPSDCTAGTWDSNVTDSNVVHIDGLTFSRTGSRCLNTSTDVSWDSTCNDSGAAGYVAPIAGEILVETRLVIITLSGQLVSDSTVTKSLTESVKIRSHLVIDIT